MRFVSTLEAEYVGLVVADRTLIPYVCLIINMVDFLKERLEKLHTINYTVFEGNEEAYSMAINKCVSTRTNYFCVKHHFFWSYVYHPEKNPADGWLLIVKCPTDLMNADYLTKGLGTVDFEANCKYIHGW